ncbi:flagellar biosynthetic protein FliO [Roseomonas sp. AR75]|jgi:flagellar protein FliO/FliZ|uniref:flagellar biosynthetic protein FliO n=1 Tax=Roseomonas sp. AR75 TaxID=2562311 RepID=UPI0010C05C05|nr:flagellar biosynthetic protein FliO [Roseomonas sp. AR75]
MHEIGWTGLLTAGATLAGILVALVLVLRGVRAAGIGRGNRRLMVEEAVALDARRRVVLLRCDGRNLLLLTGGAQDVVLGWPEPPSEGRP